MIFCFPFQTQCLAGRTRRARPARTPCAVRWQRVGRWTRGPVRAQSCCSRLHAAHRPLPLRRFRMCVWGSFGGFALWGSDRSIDGPCTEQPLQPRPHRFTSRRTLMPLFFAVLLQRAPPGLRVKARGGHRAVRPTPAIPVGRRLGSGRRRLQNRCSRGGGWKDAVGADLKVTVGGWGVGTSPPSSAGLLPQSLECLPPARARARAHALPPACSVALALPGVVFAQPFSPSLQHPLSSLSPICSYSSPWLTTLPKLRCFTVPFRPTSLESSAFTSHAAPSWTGHSGCWARHTAM